MGRDILQDLAYAWRGLRRSPAFAVAAVTVLALGIGANTAIFSAVNAFFFRPLPFAEADRLVTLYETNPEFGWVDVAAAPANLFDWRDQVEGFDGVSGYSEFTQAITAFQDGEPVLMTGTQVLGNFFETLGVPAALGRTFRMEETWDQADPVVVLSHDLWVRAFGSDPDIVGSPIEFAGSSPTVIGIMPEGFRFPSDRTELWGTHGWAESNREDVWFRRAHFVRGFARLAPGVSAADANAQLQVVAERLQRDFPETNSVMGAGLMPMRDFLIRDVRTTLMVLLGAVGLLLLLACTNVANLMLVRANDRAREVALRHALGASRWRVARQMLTESLVLATLGGIGGLTLGWLGVRAIGASTRLGIDGATTLSLDGRVVAFTVLAALLAGVLFGTAPALGGSRGELQQALRDGGQGSSAGAGSLRTVKLLVTTEIALALLLVLGAGLMVRTFVTLRQVDPGFSTEGLLAVRFSVPSSRYQARDDVLAFYDRATEMFEGRPGVEQVGWVGQLPLNGRSWSSSFQAEGWPPDRVGFEIVHRRANTAYFETVGTPLIRGRLFQPTDGPDDPLVVVINETFAREHFPGEDPLGQRIAYDRAPTDDSYWYEIIGIVGDQHQVSPGAAPIAEVFENDRQDWGRDKWAVVRTAGTPLSVFPGIRSALTELDPLIPVSETRALRDVWLESMEREQFVLTLLGIFGAVALILAAVGVYGVTAQAARRRTQEIGIRMALGAGAPQVLRMMLRQGLVVVVSGLVIGLVVAFASMRALSTLLYEVEPTDPLTMVAVLALLGGIAMVAVYVPSRRATAVDPVRSLRAD